MNHEISESQNWAHKFVMDIAPSNQPASIIEKEVKNHFDGSIDAQYREQIIGAMKQKGIDFVAIQKRLQLARHQPYRWDKHEQGLPGGTKLHWETIWRSIAAFNLNVGRLKIPKGTAVIAFACRECTRWVRHTFLQEPGPRPNMVELEALFEMTKDYWSEATNSKAVRVKERAVIRLCKAVKKRTGETCPFATFPELQEVAAAWHKAWALMLVNVPDSYGKWEY